MNSDKEKQDCEKILADAEDDGIITPRVVRKDGEITVEYLPEGIDFKDIKISQ